MDLGSQVLTGVFLPPNKGPTLTSGPIRLVKCMGQGVCGLLQLEHSYDLNEMYGLHYGYRSGLNKSMVNHLHAKVAKICSDISLQAGDIVIDIGSNDSTTLQAYPQQDLVLVGIDPTGSKFLQYYPDNIQLIPDFFSANLFFELLGSTKKARVITSFSMFYDLENPLEFMRQIHEVLADDGIWVFEQSYMPTMIATRSFDTICHEHLEFYALKQIEFMTHIVGFHILDVEFNDINGGSFSVTVCKKRPADKMTPLVLSILDNENKSGFDTLAPYLSFAKNAALARDLLIKFVQAAKAQNKTIAALGASTKGNVLLQYCNFTKEDIGQVGEVNPDKYGCLTPGSLIPIVPEEEVLAAKPDYLIVLPWHFRSFFITNPKYRGQNLVFPLPSIEVFNG